MTDAEILDAAAAMLAANETLTLSALAEKLGIARGTLYRRYADRDALVAALVATGRISAEPPDLRERILDAVATLLRERGLPGTTLDEVAKTAGVGIATVFRKFGDRRGLFHAFITERSPRRLHVELPADRDEALFVLARESLAFMRDYPALFAPITDPESAALYAELRGSTQSVRELTATLLARHFPDPTGRVLYAWTGLLYALATASRGPVDDDAHFVVTTFLHGVSR